jgi:two-component system CheB/CheR fusion protein
MTDRSPAIPVEKGSNSGLSLKEVAEETILTALEMAAALVDEQGKIFYLHGRTGYFLEPTPGVVSSQNILKMAKPGLKHPIATALHQARIQEAVIHHREIQVQWEDLVTVVQVSVHPLKRHSSAGGQPLFLVLLEKRPARRPAHTSDVPDAGRLEELRDELKTQEEYLQSTTEQMESSNEELSASNEELQSVNEELQSTNEELDTSKEELQSVNEELSTVNSELTSKVSLLTTTLNDMTNLLAATGVATVFVDLHMNILRFTPEATRIINLVPSDVGRPVGHLTSNLLNYKTLEQDTQGVLDTLVRFEAEIQTRQNAWYRLRIQPYRTLDNIIEGAVISFGDITEIVLQRQTLQSTNELLRLASVVQNSRDPIVVQDLEGRVLAWNPAAVALYGWTEEEALAANFRDHIPKELQSQTLQKMRDLVLSDSLETYQSKRLTKDGRALEVSVTSNALVTSERKIYAVSTLERVKTTKAPE